MHAEIVFQKYNEEWEEYVDLDRDAVWGVKENLKVVVSPITITLSQTTKPTVIL